MNQEELDKFENRTWITRTSRIHAEKRLLNKEKFIQWINIYYSCITIFLSIYTLVRPNERFSLLTVFVTISLSLSITYLNSQRYPDQAREFRNNYTEIMKLEYRAKHIDTECELEKLEEEYCDLLNLNNNHISYDYYCTVHEAKCSKSSDSKTRWKDIRIKYYWGVIWRFLIKIVMIILPIVILLICGVK